VPVRRIDIAANTGYIEPQGPPARSTEIKD